MRAKFSTCPTQWDCIIEIARLELTRLYQQSAKYVLCRSRKAADHDGTLLLLECVKEIDNAFSLMAIIQERGLSLEQVLLILNHNVVPQVLLNESQLCHAATRDADRDVVKRQAKWNLNSSQLIDFFSSLGVL